MADYVIQSGDTLSSIASRYGLSWQQVYEANKGSISNPNLIYRGQKITIPSGSGSSGGGGDKIPSPDLYTVNFASVDLSPEHIAQLEDKAYEELAPYYTRLLEESGGDAEKAKKRLQEDYERGVRLKTDDVARAIRYATEDKTLSDTELQPRLAIAEETLKYLDNVKFPLARQILDETYNRRGLFKSGLIQKGQADLGTEQALERSQQELTITGAKNDITRNERGLARTTETQQEELKRTTEGGAITVSRGKEDIDTALERKKKELEEARRREAIGIASSQLNREVARAETSRNYGNG